MASEWSRTIHGASATRSNGRPPARRRGTTSPRSRGSGPSARRSTCIIPRSGLAATRRHARRSGRASDARQQADHGRGTGMRVEGWLFLGCAIFFGVADAFYWGLSHDPTGGTALALAVGLAFLTGFYVLFTGRRLPRRPEDDTEGEVEQGTGEVGFFSPHSWWPLFVGLPGALAPLALPALLAIVLNRCRPLMFSPHH